MEKTVHYVFENTENIDTNKFIFDKTDKDWNFISVIDKNKYLFSKDFSKLDLTEMFMFLSLKHEINVILCCDSKEYGIGYKGRMPWGDQLKADLNHFKSVTNNHILIMGNKTYKSIGSKPLPNRECLVLSKQYHYPKNSANIFDNDKTPYDIIFNNPQSLYSRVNELIKQNKGKQIFVIGGMNLINQIFDSVNTFFITELTKSEKVENCYDTFFNKLELLKDPNRFVCHNLDSKTTYYKDVVFERKENYNFTGTAKQTVPSVKLEFKIYSKK